MGDQSRLSLVIQQVPFKVGAVVSNRQISKNWKGSASTKDKLQFKKTALHQRKSSVEMLIQLEDLMVAIRIRKRQGLPVENWVGLMDHSMMIRAYYH